MAIAVCHTVGHRARAAGKSFAFKSHDMKSAFHSGDHADINEVVRDRIHQHVQGNTIGDLNEQHTSQLVKCNIGLLEQRRGESMMRMPHDDGEVFLHTRSGGLQGDGNEPEIFMMNEFLSRCRGLADVHPTGHQAFLDLVSL